MKLVKGWLMQGLCWKRKLCGERHVADSRAHDAIYGMIARYTNVVGYLTGDCFGWLEWYWLENKMGANEMEAKASHWRKRQKIKNLDSLCRLIEADLE